MRRLNSKLDVDFISEKGNDLSEKHILLIHRLKIICVLP